MQTAISMFETLEYYEACTHLLVGCNARVGARGWASCARMLRLMRALEYFSMRNCVLSEGSLTAIARALKFGSTVRVLHLEHTLISGRLLMILGTAEHTLHM